MEVEMKIKPIALDLDGTVLNTCGCISDETLMAIKMAYYHIIKHVAYFSQLLL